MQCFVISFIIDYALHVSGSFSAHHEELKNCTHSICYVPGLLLLLLNQGPKHMPRCTAALRLIVQPC